MIKEAAITGLIGAIFGGGAATGALKFWADHTYVQAHSHEIMHEELVAGFDESVRRSSEQARIYALQDQIRSIKRRAARDGRPLTQFEINDIEEMEEQIKNLKGW